MSYQTLPYTAPGVYQAARPPPPHNSASYMSGPSQYSPPLDPKGVSYPVPPPAPARGSNLVLRISAITVGLFAVNIGVLLGLLAYIFILNKATLVGMRLLTTGSVNIINTITQAALKAMTLSIPIALALSAYRAAAQWLRGGAGEGPTPTQLGLSLSVMGAGNLMALIRGIPHLRRRTPRLAPFIRTAVFNLMLLVALDGALSAIGLAFNVTIVPAMAPSAIGRDPGFVSSLLLSRGINQTQCDDWRAQFSRWPDYVKESCGVQDSSKNGGNYYQGQAGRTLQNTSDSHGVAWTNDGTAILVASAMPDFAFSASTTGLQTKCKSVTTSCATCEDNAPGYNTGYLQCRGPTSGMFLDCLAGGVPYNTGVETSTYSTGVLEAGGNTTTASFVVSNPISWGDVIRSQTYKTDPRRTEPDYFQRTGWAIVQTYELNVLLCDITVQDVEYTFHPPSQFTITSSRASDITKAQRVIRTADDSRIQDFVQPIVDGAGIIGMPYVDAYAMQLSKVLLAMATHVHEPQSSWQFLGREELGSDMSVILLAAYVVLSAVFALSVFGIGSIAAMTCGSDPLVEATQSYLVSPLHLIQQLHGSPSNKPDALHKACGEEIFAVERDTDRLSVGPQMAYDGSWYLGTRRV